MSPSAVTSIKSGIEPFDERLGGLEHGGTYLIVGAPGPAKMVAALQFVHEGVSNGEQSLLVTDANVDGILGVANAWGFDMWEAWENGTLQIVSFRDDFELRALRTIAPEEVLEELDSVATSGLSRIAVDPGTMFLTGGAKTLLGSAFMQWAGRQDATVFATFSVDGGASSLPSSADWLVHATTGRLLLERRSGDLYQVTMAAAVPAPDTREQTISLELKPGVGLVQPESYPAQRGADRGGIDEKRLLLVSLGGSHSSDLETWATRAFDTDVVSEPFEAVTKVQAGTKYGGILIYAARKHVREAVQACRAIRPLSRAAIVFASDDAVRSTDRIHILEAGADDCLSGGLDFRELGMRIKQSIATGAKPNPSSAGTEDDSLTVSLIPDESDGGRVTRGIFIEEVERRAANPDLAFFCVLDVSFGALSPDDLESALAKQIRADEGDIVSGSPAGCAVLLQGAREGQLGPFLGRLRSKLEEQAGVDADSGLGIEVLSHPADSEQIMSLLEADGDAG